jgi:hypothetical protein
MWALLSGFCEPFLKTISTGKLATRWTHYRFSKLAKADETFEKLVQVARRLVANLASSWRIAG